jgi:hypothetical protein
MDVFFVGANFIALHFIALLFVSIRLGRREHQIIASANMIS